MHKMVACLLGTVCIGALIPAGTTARAAPLKIIHRFVAVAKGARPRAALTRDEAGNLYGTTFTGAADGNGTVFQLTPPQAGSTKWVQTVLHRFSRNVRLGVFPLSSVILDKQGNLYGTTSEGGTRTSDAGVAFELVRPASGSTDWQEVLLHRFTGRRDGGTPDGTLVFGPDGNLYGTAGYGGTQGAGVVFRLTLNGTGEATEDVLYNFTNGADGGYPYSTPIFDKAGNLYATTLNGGNAGNGVVFELTPPAQGHQAWTETVLHSFDQSTDGAEPRTGVIMDASGNLYGTTETGGTIGYGTVFEVSPPAAGGTAWTEAVLHSFGFSPDGGTPVYSSLVQDGSGVLYGTTQTGGVLKHGVVFKLTPPAKPGAGWKESVMHDFSETPDGAEPESGLLLASDGSLIGTTLFGGTANDDGTVFQIKP